MHMININTTFMWGLTYSRRKKKQEPENGNGSAHPQQKWRPARTQRQRMRHDPPTAQIRLLASLSVF
jgi:hypothetical protein